MIATFRSSLSANRDGKLSGRFLSMVIFFSWAAPSTVVRESSKSQSLLTSPLWRVRLPISILEMLSRFLTRLVKRLVSSLMVL